MTIEQSPADEKPGMVPLPSTSANGSSIADRERDSDALQRQVEELTQALSSSRAYINSLEASIRGTDSGVASDNEITETESAQKRGSQLSSLGLGTPSSAPADPSSAEGADLLPPISGITGLVPLPHSAPMYNLRRKASGQLGSQAADARAALAFKLENQAQGDVSGGLTRKGVNRIPSSVVQSHISLTDSASPAKTRQYRSNSTNGIAPASPTKANGHGAQANVNVSDQEDGAEEILRDEAGDGDDDNTDQHGLSRSVTPTGLGGVPSRIPRPSDTPPPKSTMTGIVSISPPRPRLRANPSTQMISTLQQQVETHRQHLDRVKAELRASQRLVAQLTRQNEDLKETKERMRAENDSLGVVLSRKERLLSEVLERARSAEATASTLTKERKQIEGSTKKSLAEMKDRMETALTTASRSEREAVILRETIVALKESWKKEVKLLRVETKEATEASQLQRQEADEKFGTIMRLIESQSQEQSKLDALHTQLDQNDDKLLSILQPELKEIQECVSLTGTQDLQNQQTAAELKAEISLLTRLMRDDHELRRD